MTREVSKGRCRAWPGLGTGRSHEIHYDAGVRRATTTAVLVALGYYAGVHVGLVLKFPAVHTVVRLAAECHSDGGAAAHATTTLVDLPARGAARAPRRRIRDGVAAPAVLALFATNCGEALIAAVGVRWLSDTPARFDTPAPDDGLLVAAGLVAPFLSSFLDAAAVTIVRGELYWSVWQRGSSPTALTGLMLVPAIVMGVTAGPAWLRRAPGARRAEAALLTVALVLVGGWVFV